MNLELTKKERYVVAKSTIIAFIALCIGTLMMFSGMLSVFVCFVLLFIYAFFCRYLYKRRCNHMESKLKHYTSSVLTSLTKVDYYARSFYSGIAVDVNAKAIAVIEGNEKDFSSSKPIVISTDKITGWAAFAPGYDVESSSNTYATGSGPFTGIAIAGAAITNQVGTRSRNKQAKMEAAKQTGLYIDLDDIHKQKLFVRLPYEDAEKWILVIDKLVEDTLQPESTPVQFPVLQN
ncbi:hypothetical protein OKT24_05005 [Aeromonas veronii]|nr:hypothetical protein [Aeromonas veronii]